MKSNMLVKCSTHADFMAVIYDSVARGLLFKADYDALTIYYTGGF